jgi:hypothetical protein
MFVVGGGGLGCSLGISIGIHLSSLRLHALEYEEAVNTVLRHTSSLHVVATSRRAVLCASVSRPRRALIGLLNRNPSLAS